MARVDLSGEWTLRQVGSDEIIKAHVPGDVHSALLACGKIPDPYWADNEQAVQWVGRADWEYARTFVVDGAMLEAPSVYLHFDTIDTFSEVYLNGQLVAKTDNMFLRHRFEVKRLLVAGENELRVVLRSA